MYTIIITIIISITLIQIPPPPTPPSYTNNEESPHDPDGVALVWNTRFKKTTPEYIFHCQSPVMSATFAR